MLSDELLEAGGCQRVLIGELLATKKIRKGMMKEHMNVI